LDSQKLTPDNIKAYAQQLAGTIPLKAVGNGDKQIYVATLSNGQQIRLRSVSSSASQTRARWTIDIQGNPDINNSLGLSSKEKVEIKFR